MLRLVVLVLLLLNVGYFAWNEGWLRVYGWAPAQQREPERVTQQINPQALTLAPQPATAATSPAQPASAPVAENGAPNMAACLQSNTLDADQVDVLRPILESQFKPETWQLEERRAAPQWMVYLGKFASKADQAQKRTQLSDLKIKFEPVSVAELTPGYSLGVFASQKAAAAALANVVKRGVRGARLVQVQDATPKYALLLKSADPAQATVQALIAAQPALALTTCSDPQER